MNDIGGWRNPCGCDSDVDGMRWAVYVDGKVVALFKSVDRAESFLVLLDSEEKRKHEHCYGTYCHYLTERKCLCLCSQCGVAKKMDH